MKRAADHIASMISIDAVRAGKRKVLNRIETGKRAWQTKRAVSENPKPTLGGGERDSAGADTGLAEDANATIFYRGNGVAIYNYKRSIERRRDEP